MAKRLTGYWAYRANQAVWEAERERQCRAAEWGFRVKCLSFLAGLLLLSWSRLLHLPDIVVLPAFLLQTIPIMVSGWQGRD